MLWNGQRVVLDMAIRALDHPLTTRYRPALVLGALREDVWYVPLIGAVLERPSLTHFYRPGLPGGMVPFRSPRLRGRTDGCGLVVVTVGAFAPVFRAGFFASHHEFIEPRDETASLFSSHWLDVKAQRTQTF